MEITVQQLKALAEGSYQIIDIRDEEKVAYGAIPGAVILPPDHIEGSPVASSGKKLIICCSVGRISIDVAQNLSEKGYDAVSLAGGYTAWLLDRMQEEKDEEINTQAEQSIRKKFRKSIWCKFTKAIN